MDGYSKKKYVCKLLFIFLLGHDIDFGHMEAVNLLSSNKYTEKQIVSKKLLVFECHERRKNILPEKYFWFSRDISLYPFWSVQAPI